MHYQNTIAMATTRPPSAALALALVVLSSCHAHLQLSRPHARAAPVAAGVNRTRKVGTRVPYTGCSPPCTGQTACVISPQSPEGTCMPTYPDVKVVHVINSCHLDIGFINTSAAICNLYFDHHIPLAVAVGEQLRNTDPSKGAVYSDFTDNKLGFMFQSW